MVSCVADPHENEAKCATNKRRESNWYLSEIGLLLATLTATTPTTEVKVFVTVQLGTMTPTRSYINSRPAWRVKNKDLSNVCYLGTFREVTE